MKMLWSDLCPICELSTRLPANVAELYSDAASEQLRQIYSKDNLLVSKCMKKRNAKKQYIDCTTSYSIL